MAQIYDQHGNVIRTIAVDHATGDFQTVMEMECDDLIAENQRLRDNQTGKENFRLAARVPGPVVERAMIEGWFHDDKAWERWMNNGDNKAFRVWEGRV